jgi:hypothetical protein
MGGEWDGGGRPWRLSFWLGDYAWYHISLGRKKYYELAILFWLIHIGLSWRFCLRVQSTGSFLKVADIQDQFIHK